MRRLPRILLTAATAVSLGLSVATVALWVRSHWRWDYAWYQDALRCSAVHSKGGQVAFATIPYEPPEAFGPLPQLVGASVTREAGESWSDSRSGFDWWLPTGTRGFTCHLVAPHWFVTLVLGAAPVAAAARAVLRRRRVAPGRCPTCGYDLRAPPDRCPERLC